MAIKLVTLCVDERSGRRLNLAVDGSSAYAFIAGSPPPEQTFEFNPENMNWVIKGLTYQAWGEGGHMCLSLQDDGMISVEFKSSAESRSSRCEIPKAQFEQALERLCSHSIADQISVY